MKNMKKNPGVMAIVLVVLISGVLSAQEKNSEQNYTAYELMSKYYSDNFHPFKKKNIYLGLAFSLEDLQQENTAGLLQNIVDGQKLQYNILVKSGYYLNNYTALGINFSYNYNKFVGQVYRDPDTLQSNSILRSFDFTPKYPTIYSAYTE